MKRHGGGRLRLACGAAGLALVLVLVSVLSNPVWTANDDRGLVGTSGSTKTVCVGRFLIDLPVQAEVRFGLGGVGGLDLSTTRHESDAEFTDRLQTAKRNIAEALNEDSQASLELVKEIKGEGSKGQLFVHNRRRSNLRRGDHVLPVENVGVYGLLRFSGLSITANADWLDPDYVDDVAHILGRIRPLLPSEIPEEPGFCLADALVRDPYEHRKSESIVMFAGLPGHPDVNIVLDSMSGTSPAPGLLQRNSAAAARESIFVQMAFTNLREKARVINGLHGEELVTRIREPNLTTGYSFQWEARGEQGDVFAPLVTLEIESGTPSSAGGKPVQSTLSEKAMLELWERIASSIRLRPIKIGKTI